VSTRTGSSRATSRSLLARVRENDVEAWNRLVSLYAPFVYHFCRRAGLDAADASDVFQEVFQATWSKLSTFEKREQGGTFRGWLRTITMNKVRDHFRRRAREPLAGGGTDIQLALAGVSAPGDEDDAGLDDASFDPERAESELLRRALEVVREGFQERTWQAFLGTAVEGRSPRDVGDDLGMSQGAVRVAKSRVLQRLRAELGEYGTRFIPQPHRESPAGDGTARGGAVGG